MSNASMYSLCVDSLHNWVHLLLKSMHLLTQEIVYGSPGTLYQDRIHAMMPAQLAVPLASTCCQCLLAKMSSTQVAVCQADICQIGQQ